MYKFYRLTHKSILTLFLALFIGSSFHSIQAQGCTLANYTTATRIAPTMFPYFSAGSGITVTATVFNVPTLGNSTYTCGGNSFACSATAWWHQYATGWIQLNFSSPIYKMTWVLNGSNTGEVFTFTPNTGTVTLSDFCSGAGNFSAVGNQLTCLGSLGTIVSVNHPTGMTQLTVYHNGTGSGSRMSPLDCFVTSPLPVSLSIFDGMADNAINNLFWETTTEVNSDYFIIEKSFDAIHYTPVGQINAAGNSNITHTYSISDVRPYSKTYYRLKQVDLNGEQATYGPILIENQHASNIQISDVYPNPAFHEFYIDITSVQSEEFRVIVMDGLGKIKSNKFYMVEGSSKISLECMTWPKGVYQVFVQHQQSGLSINKKVIVQ